MISKHIDIRQSSREINTEEKLIEYIKTQLGEPMITVDVTEKQILNCIDDAFLKFQDWNFDAQSNMVFVIDTQLDIKEYILDDRVKAIYGMSIADTLSGYASASSSAGSWGGIPLSSIAPPQYVPAVAINGDTTALEQSGYSKEGISGVAGGIAGGPHTGGGNPMDAAWANAAKMQQWANMFGTTVSFDFNRSTHILRFFSDVSGPVAIEAGMDYIPNPDGDYAYRHPWIKEYSLNLVKRVWGWNVGKYDSPIIGGASINYERLISEANEAIEKLEQQLIEESESLGIATG